MSLPIMGPQHFTLKEPNSIRNMAPRHRNGRDRQINPEGTILKEYVKGYKSGDHTIGLQGQGRVAPGSQSGLQPPSKN